LRVFNTDEKENKSDAGALKIRRIKIKINLILKSDI